MRWPHLIFIQCLLIAIIAGIVYTHKDRVIMIKNPPTSLAQWYKPENKRQVWLHNMFKLRREMQAIRFYAQRSDSKHLQKWVTQLSEHYLKIGSMVPEWKDKLNLKSLENLQQTTKMGNKKNIILALDDLTESCETCHTDYRSITATLYRAPNFSSLNIKPSISFSEHMKKLTIQINQIKISSKDGMTDIALDTLSSLKDNMNLLGGKCVNCHKQDSRTYPNDVINNTINKLAQSLKTGTLKEQGKELGTLAVLACARCHGTHRLAYDNRTIIAEKSNWMQLIQH